MCGRNVQIPVGNLDEARHHMNIMWCRDDARHEYGLPKTWSVVGLVGGTFKLRHVMAGPLFPFLNKVNIHGEYY